MAVHHDVPDGEQGMWRTPHPNPNPLQNGTKGLSGAVGITMVYLTDGTVLFTERPHDVVAGVPANPLLVVGVCPLGCMLHACTVMARY